MLAANNNNQTNLQKNLSNPPSAFSVNQLSQQKSTNFLSNFQNNQSQVNYSTDLNTNNFTHISNSHNGSYSTPNN